mmetsp:Transcript_8969/g.26940  ORF Transcript_8969/g.26940 Transcript_8969/m.26940 type:complete len:129 (-) Transcript_8969:83-469(-)|eukprot:CAMPEP_0198731040 /NCGR_PEP_ID=MMETSP1475-20131203/27738_1 /TAXON_ID= ORGANISM="Unidentified sp., Strain CCMP1999" /NCGR_SAMPLE_ID=MMETSP1475 /ASSEMBLY_ACC=CAM_ASM_001111 /LENGTH=128 /DNA_ID=CAMNT_0044493941 /DNA_START=87 /DNA_END=473 /DNA_ORIENTATION=+
MSLLRLLRRAPGVSTSVRSLHSSGRCLAQDKIAIKDDQYIEHEAVPFGEHPENPYYEDGQDSLANVFIIGWLTAAVCVYFGSHHMRTTDITLWAREEFLEREAKARITARASREDARIQAEAAEAASQ